MARIWLSNRFGLHSSSASGASVEFEHYGFSQGPYRSLNLGMRVGDDPGVVKRNREQLKSLLEVEELRFMDQVHGCDIELVKNFSEPERQVDALFLKRSDSASSASALAVQVADCIPVIFHSKDLIGAIHIGRMGLFLGITEIAAAFALGEVSLEELEVSIGPSICGDCYQVSADIYQQITAKYPAAGFRESENKIDIAAALTEIFEGLNISWSWFSGERICVSCTREYFSYRRDKVTGRQAMIVSW
jgi:YfiH family protein